jgi:acetolactate decarboxylase
VSQLVVDVPASLEAALEEEKARSGRSMSSLITAALAQFLEKPVHIVFQVSTSGALVAGVYDREVRVQAILYQSPLMQTHGGDSRIG